MVELIVGMAVTSILLVGITGVLFSASTAYSRWIDRIETSGTGDVLAEALMADSHRYVPCVAGRYELDFCFPKSTSRVAITYRNYGSGPYSIMREEKISPASSRVLARDLPAQLAFQVTCTELTNVDVGFVTVLSLPGRDELDVHYQTARGTC
jgi:hypothetical protein